MTPLSFPLAPFGNLRAPHASDLVSLEVRRSPHEPRTWLGSSRLLIGCSSGGSGSRGTDAGPPESGGRPGTGADSGIGGSQIGGSSAGGGQGNGGASSDGRGSGAGGGSTGGDNAGSGGSNGGGPWNAGNPDGSCEASVPAEGQPADAS